ncbi:MAG: cupredoxin domain-containing protein [Deltaproteobacteria bacterium]|jgi:cytochrome c oxidase subunit II|nr:cupredoxin domain-containing protein [Deltaproteobacteria bacterium]
MNSQNKRRTIALAFTLVGAALISGSGGGWSTRRVLAAEQPQVIEIKAKKFEFSPGKITLKKGAPVVLRLSTEDRSHGFFVKPLGIDADIEPGQFTDVAITPDATGEYAVICDHYCGLGHGNMKMTVTVVQ